MANLDIKHPKYCPFKKIINKMHDVVGPHYTPVVVSETEDFTICIGEDCMLYKYDPGWKTEECLLGRKYEE